MVFMDLPHMTTRLPLCFATAAAAALLSGCGPADTALDRGLEHLRAGRYARAVRALRRGAASETRRGTAYCNLGIAQWRAGSPENAAESFRKAIEFSGDPRPWEYLGRVCVELGRDDEARSALERSRSARPTPACLTALGALEMKAGRYEAATNLLAAALSMKPGYAPALYNMAVATRRRHGAGDISRTWAGRYLEADPAGPRAAGVRSLFDGDAPGAPAGPVRPTGGAAVQPAAKPAAKEFLAEAAAQAARGNKASVEALILKARRAEPDNPDVLWETARLYEMLGLDERAAGAKDLFRREFPNDRRSASLRRDEPAPVRADRGAPAAAAAEPAPDPRRTAIQLWSEGLKHHKAGELDAAIGWYRKALQADDKLVSAYYNLGLACRQKNDNLRARDAFMAAVSVSPQMHDARYMLASCYRSLGDTEKAAVEARKILQMDDGYANAHLLLGMVYREKNLPSQARPHLERYVRLEPDGPMADQARGWIRDMR